MIKASLYIEISQPRDLKFWILSKTGYKSKKAIDCNSKRFPLLKFYSSSLNIRLVWCEVPKKLASRLLKEAIHQGAYIDAYKAPCYISSSGRCEPFRPALSFRFVRTISIIDDLYLSLNWTHFFVSWWSFLKFYWCKYDVQYICITTAGAAK